MNAYKNLMIAAALLFSGHALAASADHPASPDAAATPFRPADYFVGKPIRLAADEHQHDATVAKSADEGKSCKREEKSCCCKCCEKQDSKEGQGCMRKSGEQDHDHEHDEGKPGCGMMKKGIDDHQENKDGASDAHEGHH